MKNTVWPYLLCAAKKKNFECVLLSLLFNELTDFDAHACYLFVGKLRKNRGLFVPDQLADKLVNTRKTKCDGFKKSYTQFDSLQGYFELTTRGVRSYTLVPYCFKLSIQLSPHLSLAHLSNRFLQAKVFWLVRLNSKYITFECLHVGTRRR